MNDSNKAKIFDQTVERPGFEIMDGVLYFRGRLWVPSIDGQQNVIMTEAHHTCHLIHPGSTKMFQNLKDRY